MRYQFIRDKDAFGDESEPGLIGWDGLVELDANEFDAAIDARMAHPGVAYTPAPNGMMQLSNELAEMKRKCVELEVQLDELAAQEPVAYITERNLKLLKNGLHDCFVKHKPIMVRPIPLFTRAAPLTAKQPTPATTFDAAAAIRACMDEFPLAVQDIVEECAVIAENTIRSAGGTAEGGE